MADENGEKTEEPSEFRLEEARRKGQVARSKDLVASGMMVAAAIGLMWFSRNWSEHLGTFAARSLSAAPQSQLDISVVRAYASEAVSCLAMTLLPLMSLMIFFAVALNVVQVGFMASPEALQPKLSHLSPLSGLKRLFSVQALVRLPLSLLKLLLVTAIAGLFFYAAFPGLIGLLENEWGFVVDSTGSFREQELPVVVWSVIRSGVVELAFQLALALLILGLFDLWFQKWKHRQDLRMTRQEMMDELKNFIGDPKTRGRREEVRRLIAEARTNDNVKTADVVVTNPTHISVALKYDPQTMLAPQVVARGADRRALLIRQIAATHGVPIIERKPIARALYKQVRVGQEIPGDMYAVFAEIMAYVYKLSGRKPPAT